MAGFQAGGGSEGWVVDASVYPGIFFRIEAVGRGWLHGRQAQYGLQNHLIVGRWGLRNGFPDPLGGSDGRPFRCPLVIHRGVLLRLSAFATEALSQVTDAQEWQDDQDDDDRGSQGAGEELIHLWLVLLAAAVTTASESFRAGE